MQYGLFFLGVKTNGTFFNFSELLCISSSKLSNMDIDIEFCMNNEAYFVQCIDESGLGFSR